MLIETSSRKTQTQISAIYLKDGLIFLSSWTDSIVTLLKASTMEDIETYHFKDEGKIISIISFKTSNSPFYLLCGTIFGKVH